MNKEIILFAGKALGFFIAWYLLYELWLLPDGSLDLWISLNIIEISSGILSAFDIDVLTYNRVIGIRGMPGIEVVNGCNGIAAMGLFIGFIIAYPGKPLNRFSFAILGVSVIYFVNLIRIVTLTLTQKYWPEFFDFTHDYSTTTIFYLVIFALWVIWINQSDAEWGKSISAES